MPGDIVEILTKLRIGCAPRQLLTHGLTGEPPSTSAVRDDVGDRLPVDGERHSLTSPHGVQDARCVITEIPHSHLHVLQRSSFWMAAADREGNRWEESTTAGGHARRMDGSSAGPGDAGGRRTRHRVRPSLHSCGTLRPPRRPHSLRVEPPGGASREPSRLSDWATRIDGRLADRRTGVPLVLTSASVGVPPLAAMSVMAGASSRRRRDFTVACLVGRTLRFAVIVLPAATLLP